jgi:hypothetical protein
MKNLLIVFILLVAMDASGQSFRAPKLSVPGTITQEIGLTTVSIYYERPSARGRTEEEIFGKLVPFGQRWRTGAGNGTRMRFNTDVFIGNQLLKKGFYFFLTIPEREKWTIIFNADTAEYRSTGQLEKDDVLKFDVPVGRSSRFYEALTYDIDIIPNNGKIYISWLNTQVSFDVKTRSDENVIEYVEKNLLTGKSNDPKEYEQAVFVYDWHNRDPNEILRLIEKGSSLRDDRYWYYVKVKLLEKQGRISEAITACDRAISVVRKSTEGDEAWRKSVIEDFANRRKTLEEKKSAK